MELGSPLPLRQYMIKALPGPMAVDVHGLRPVRRGDAEMLADLMMDAYLGTIDYEGETRAQALDEIRDTLSGGKGPFDWESSRVIARDDSLASASLLISWHGEPFVCFSMTAARFKRHGLARACLVASMAELSRRGATALRLLVTRANLPAVAMYESLGFEWQACG
jgi:ribosomal protein S18 acetylase RimI-like enzyme